MSALDPGMLSPAAGSALSSSAITRCYVLRVVVESPGSISKSLPCRLVASINHASEVFPTRSREIILKSTISLAVVAVLLVACASNQASQSVESTNGTTTGDSAVQTPEKVCKSETGGRLGGRNRRVCRSVDAI